MVALQSLNANHACSLEMEAMLPSSLAQTISLVMQLRPQWYHLSRADSAECPGARESRYSGSRVFGVAVRGVVSEAQLCKQHVSTSRLWAMFGDIAKSAFQSQLAGHQHALCAVCCPEHLSFWRGGGILRRQGTNRPHEGRVMELVLLKHVEAHLRCCSPRPSWVRWHMFWLRVKSRLHSSMSVGSPYVLPHDWLQAKPERASSLNGSVRICASHFLPALSEIPFLRVRQDVCSRPVDGHSGSWAENKLCNQGVLVSHCQCASGECAG